MKTSSLLSKFTGPVRFATNYFNAKKDAIRSTWENNCRSIPVETETTAKFNSFCCALCLISANSETTAEELNYQIDRMKEEAKLRWTPASRASGERACIVQVIAPHEDKLRETLKQLNFLKLWEFPRRNGYGPGTIEMWGLQW